MGGTKKFSNRIKFHFQPSLVGWIAGLFLVMVNLSCALGETIHTGGVSNQGLPTEAAAIPEEPNASPVAGADVTATPQSAVAAIPEDRRLVLEWPSRIRVGDSALIQITLEMDDQGIVSPTASVGGDQIVVEPIQIPNLYATHQVIAQARLDMAGIEYRPSGDIREALLPGQAVRFIWSVRPIETGTYRGTVWLHLLFIPRDGGEELQTVLSAQTIDLQVVNLLGLSGNGARILGSVGAVLGSFISLENLFPWVWRAIKGFRSKKLPGGS